MSESRRFAFVSPNYYPRVCGVGDHSARLADELLRRGLEARVFSRSPVERHPEANAVDVCGAAGRLPTTVAWEISNAIGTYRPTDVVIQYTSQMWGAWRFGSPAMVLLAARLRRAGARITLIAHELHVPWQARPDLAAAALLQRLQFSALLKSSDRVFVTTSTRAQNLAPLCRLLRAAEPAVIRVGPSALPLEHAPPSGSATFPRIGFFSTAAVGKRFDVVLDAFAQISGEFPGSQLVLLGDLGPSDHPRVVEVINAVSNHPHKDRIGMTGKLPLARIATEIAKLDLYLFPMNTGANTRSSTLPVALGSGVPTVAMRGIETDPLLFRANETVVFAEELSGPAFAEAALRLLRNAVLRKQVAEGGRRLYEEHMSWERIADRLLADA
jgi:glycosyltransferase involved in cell wall biosynthesis